MDSPHSPGYFEDEDLRALQSALEDIWSDLKAHDPDRNWDADNELKTRIAEKLMALASTGINRPEELSGWRWKLCLCTGARTRGSKRRPPRVTAI